MATYTSQVKWKECCYLGPWTPRWWDRLSNLRWSAAYSWLFSLMNSRPCRRVVWVLHLTAATAPLRPSAWKTTAGGWFGRAAAACGRTAEGGRKCSGSHRPVTWRRLERSTRTPPTAPFVSAGHDDCLTLFAWERLRGRGGITKSCLPGKGHWWMDSSSVWRRTNSCDTL